MRYPAHFESAITLPDSHSIQSFIQLNDEKINPLPKDGLPRITTEGVEILKEGLRGDFSRWVWSIGNHPLEIPDRCVRNLIIRAMNDRPHFIAEFWSGNRFPKTKHLPNLLPYYCFDVLDTLVTEYHTEPIYRIHLKQSADYWAHIPILIDDLEIATDGFEDDSEGDGMAEVVINKPTKTPDDAAVTTLDRWGF